MSRPLSPARGVGPPIERPENSGWLASVTFRETTGEADVRLAEGDSDSRKVERSNCIVVFGGVLFDRQDLVRSVSLDANRDTDAGLVAAAYDVLGQEALARLRGTFALIVWDRLRHQLVCARDQLGSHPLFYAEQPNGILLSSSLGRLLSHPAVSRDLNPSALVDHLCHRWPDAGETHFASIRRVPVAHILVWRAGRLQIEPYWELATPEAWIDDDELDQFDALFERAVRRPSSPGPTGIFLSGGFDSVSIAAVAADLAQQRGDPAPWALSLAFPHPDCDEAEIQRSVAAKLGIPQTLMRFDEAVGPAGLVNAGIELSAELPLPLVNPWRPAYMRLGKDAREHGCTTLLTGAGGDEWLTVNPYYMADLLRRGDLMGAGRFAGTILKSYRRSRQSMIRFLIWQAGLQPLILLAGRRGLQRIAPDRVHAKRRRDLRSLTPLWVRPSGDLAEAVSRRIEQRVEQRAQEPEPSGNHGFYFRGLDSPVLHPERSREQEEDFEVGRRLGSRIQHPYWDPDLISFLCRVPPRLLMMNGREKALVREAVNRRFPGVGFGRQKKVTATGFFQERLQRELYSAWNQLGGATALGALGFVDPQVLEQAVAPILGNGDLRRLHGLWEVMILEAWVRPQQL
ncbi:MAG: asparagine synthase-related protein [Gaiellaceae bacterium]